MQANDTVDDAHGQLGQPLNGEQLARIATRMRGVDGVAISNRRHRVRIYPDCFVGNQAVDWLMAQYALTRPQAVRMGERLHAHRLITHVLEEHDFIDGPLFYRFATSTRAELPGDREAMAYSDQQLRTLMHAMRGRHGPRLGTHYHLLVRYPECFDARDAVTWLVRHLDVDRPLATAIGRRLLRRDWIRHVFDDHDFEDRRLFYRFV